MPLFKTISSLKGAYDDIYLRARGI